MPRYSNIFLQLVLCAVLAASAIAQELRVHALSEFTSSCESSDNALYYGIDGTLWALCEEGGQRKLRYHDGKSWSSLTLLTEADVVVPEASGRLLLRRGRVLYTHTVRGSVVTTSRWLTPDATSAITYAVLRSANQDLVVETGAGIMSLHAGGGATLLARTAYLLTVDARGVLVYAMAGGLQYLSGAHLPCAYASVARRMGARTRALDGSAAFVLGDSLYLHQAAKLELRGLEAPAASAKLIYHHGYVYATSPHQHIRVSGLQLQQWWPLYLGDPSKHRVLPNCYADATATGVASDSRVLLSSTNGWLSVEQSTVSALKLGLEGTGPPILATCPGGLLAANTTTITRLRERGKQDYTGQIEYETSDNLMRYSVPSALAWFGGRPVVATSDARVIALDTAGGEATEITGVRRAGGHIFDLLPRAGELWGCFDPSVYDNVGLFSYRPGSPRRVYTRASGLTGRVLSVREAPSGRLFASTSGGEAPVYRYLASQDLWLPLRLSNQREAVGAVTEVAPINDTTLYLASERGLWNYTLSSGYELVALPHQLLGIECLSVLAQDDGVWFVLRGKGAFYLTGNQLVRVQASGDWLNREFKARGLRRANDGSVLVVDGEQVFRLSTDAGTQSIAAEINLSRSDLSQQSIALNPKVRFSLEPGDSLHITYSLPGFATSRVEASYMINGQAVRPVRERVGYACFAPLPTGNHELLVRVDPVGLTRASSVRMQSLRVRPPWYTTVGGIFAIISVSLCGIGICGYILSVRQRRLARQLERTVAERTVELANAQRRAERASAAKSTFLSNMSHEIRTPLNAVLGVSTLLADTQLTEEQTTYLATIERGGRTLHHIVRDLLAFVQIDSGTLRRRDAQAPLRKMLDELVVDQAAAADQVGLVFGYDLGNVPESASYDEPKLRSIINQLLSNAIKFTDAGSVDLRVQIGRVDTSTNLDAVARQELRIQVLDTGCGINVDQLDRLFEPFEQADNSATRRHGGTGIGLTIVKTYVACLGGTVSVQARRSGGTVFTVLVPITTGAPPPSSLVGATPLPTALLAGEPELTRRIEPHLQLAAFALIPFASLNTAQQLPKVVVAIVDALHPLDITRALPTVRKVLSSGGQLILVGTARSLEGTVLQAQERLLTYPFLPEALDVLRRELQKPPVAVQPATPASLPTSSQAKASTASSVGLSAKPATPASAFFDLHAEHPLSILVAEDNPMNKMLALSVLSKLGYRADWAENGAKALEAFAGKRHDLIFMDVHMPEMDGLTATREIRSQFPQLPVYICALTANATDEGRSECEEVGMDDFVSKPLKVEHLVEVIRRVRPLSDTASIALNANVQAQPT